MEHFNDTLFLLLNAPAHPGALTLLPALLLANWSVPIIITGFIWVWVRGPAENRGVLMVATLTMLLGEAGNQIIGMVVLHPRPFMIGLGHTLIPHAPDNSFPSDHGTFVWSLGFSLIATRRLRAAGWTLSGIGLGVAWSRIYLGVHFPLDMAGAAAVSAAVAGLSPAMLPAVERWLVPPCSTTYEFALRTLRLPAAAFPRRLPSPPGPERG